MPDICNFQAKRPIFRLHTQFPCDYSISQKYISYRYSCVFNQNSWFSISLENSDKNKSILYFLLFRGHGTNDNLKGYNIWALIVSEVELDVLTGERNILRCDLMEDTGATINPEVDIGQIEGAFVFSLGWWLQEQIKFDPITGQLLTNDTWVRPPFTIKV